MNETYELKPISRPTRIINFKWDSINLNNVLTKTITTGFFWKKSLTLRLKTGEYIKYDNIQQDEIDRLFKG